MSTSLPERPDLDQLRRQAKELRNAASRGDPDAVARFAIHHGSRSQGGVDRPWVSRSRTGRTMDCSVFIPK
jgi:hypothetical protein